MNPFKKGKYMLPVASINSVYVDSTKAYDLFRPVLIIDEILKRELVYTTSFDQKEIISEFDQLLKKKNSDAIEIALIFSKRLSFILKTLKSPSQESISNRKNWTDIHWDYWKTINKVFFVGGLTTSNFTTILYDYIAKDLLNNSIKLNIEFIEDSSNLGIQGLASISTKNTLLFDFGQTNVKRGYVNSKDEFISLDTIPSKHLDYKDLNNKELRESALKMHQFIIDVIKNTSKSLQEIEHIKISIANYIIDGEIYPSRGAYGKLALLDGNYQKLLEKDVNTLLGSGKIEVEIHHDTSSMALNFKKIGNSAVISLGTAFGVAFPE